jgi:hypothetical protein
MLRKILVGVAAAVGLVVGALALIVAMRPSEFRIERSTTIAAPAPKGSTRARRAPASSSREPSAR